jgi:hypothetical protein
LFLAIKLAVSLVVLGIMSFEGNIMPALIFTKRLKINLKYTIVLTRNPQGRVIKRSSFSN